MQTHYLHSICSGLRCGRVRGLLDVAGAAHALAEHGGGLLRRQGGHLQQSQGLPQEQHGMDRKGRRWGGKEEEEVSSIIQLTVAFVLPLGL